jgi:hopanoid biosynthesis associated RND transporter like protein HpnN
MSAEGKPQSDRSFMARPLEWLTRLVVRFPVATLVLAGVVTAVSLYLTATRLGFRTSRAELLNPKSEFNQRWIEYTKEFGDKEDVVVVVEGDGPENVVPVLDELAAVIAEDRGKNYSAVLAGIDLAKIRSKGLYYLKPDDLTAIEGFLDQMSPVLRGDWKQLSPTSMGSWMSASLQQGDAAQREQAMAEMTEHLGRMVRGLGAVLGPEREYRSPWPDVGPAAAAMDMPTVKHLLENDGRIGFVLLRLTKEDNQNFAQNGEAIDGLKRLAAQMRTRHPHVKIGLTGLPVIEHDEMRSSESSMSLATILSFAGVLAVLVVAFGAFRHSLLAMGGLVVGMIWACGCVTLTVGHVNVLSIAFGSILFGLGIDYGTYYVARYLELRGTGRSARDAIVETAGGAGPGITTGAVTSAIAFFATGLTDFSGVAQLGVIAGGGVLLCWLAQMTVLPAAILLLDRYRSGQRTPLPLDLHRYLKPAIYARPRTMLGTNLAATVVLAALGLGLLWYDHNLLNLQPQGLESVELEKKLCNELNRSAYFAISIADSPEELRTRKAQFEVLPSVERVEDIGPLLPEQTALKGPIITRIRERLQNLPAEAPAIPVAPAADLEKMLGAAQMMLGGAQGGQVHVFGGGSSSNGTPSGRKMDQSPDPAKPLADQLAQVRGLLRQTAPADYQHRMGFYQQCVAADLLGRLHALRAAADPAPPQASDLPAAFRVRNVGRHGRYLQKIYSRVDIWDMAGMERFVKQVRSVDKQATGNPLQIYEASRQMKRSFEQAAWYALFAIIPFVFLDYRRLSHSLLAVLPMCIGLLQTMALLGLMGMPLNPANMIVLPLTLGIGVEDGVNIIHDFRNQGRKYRYVSGSTIVAVVVNSLTTMVGFGALMIANHQGLQSLGRVLTISMAFNLFNSLMLPNMLALYCAYLRNRERCAAEAPADAPPSLAVADAYRRNAA